MDRNRDMSQRYRSGGSGTDRQQSYQGYGAGYTGSQNQGYTAGNQRGGSQGRGSFAGEGGYGGGYQGYNVDSDYKGSNYQGTQYRNQNDYQNDEYDRNSGNEGPTSDWLPNNYRSFDQGNQGYSSTGHRGSWETGNSWSNQYQPNLSNRNYYSEYDTNDRTPGYGNSRYNDTSAYGYGTRYSGPINRGTNYGSYGVNRPSQYDNSYRAYDSDRREPHGVWEEVKNFFGFGPKGYKRSDERIREEVSEALYRDPYINASEIEVDVNDGMVTLKGTVSERRMKRLAEDCAADVSGVDDVRNEIRVQPSSMATSSGTESATTSSRSTGDKQPKSRSDRLM